jgi:hypothetical protein
MRALTAFFAGAGTVVIVVAAGLGGGLLIADTMNPKTPAQQATKLERRTTPAPSPSLSPHLAAAPAAATPAVKDAPAQPAQDAAKEQSSATTATNAAATKPDASEPSPAPSPSSQPWQHDAHDKSGAFDAAFARARDADLRRQTRRHQRWVERHRMQREPEANPRDVEQAWRDDAGARNDRDDSGVHGFRADSGPHGNRDDSGARGYRDDRSARGYTDESNGRAYQGGHAYQDGNGRGDAAEPVELELPRIRLFDGF